VTQSWRVGGDEGKTSIAGGQYFYTINVRNGWQVFGQPNSSYNHNAPEGNKE